ncbi:hypothetical protein [Sphingopyxis sp. P1IMeth2]|uniref:hypothetical protein n=1 Tax=Sphingopyxis sp. P1IMeth2 TaxID=1892848 RepID=UPI001647FBBF|nr:hypothetical protein [Sphingopyxis sp. P1IMeth2]
MRQGKNGRGRPEPQRSDDYAAGTLAALLVEIVDERSRMVISTKVKPQSHGVCDVWGIDEPWPEGCEPK